MSHLIVNCLLLLIIVSVTISMNLKITPCGECRLMSTEMIALKLRGGKVTEVRGFGCLNDTQPCVIKRGSKVKLEIDFTSPYNSRWAFVSVFGRTGTRLFPVYIPWNGVSRNGCYGYGIECPIIKEKKYTYHFNMTVPHDAPVISTEYTWRVSNVWGMTIGCYSMPLQVV